MTAATSSDSASMTQTMQRFIEEFLRQQPVSWFALDKKDVEEEVQIEIFVNGERIKEDPELAGKLKILQQLPEGTVIPDAANIKVDLVLGTGESQLRETVFETDEQGQIKTNILQPKKAGKEVVAQSLNTRNDKEIDYLKTLVNDLRAISATQQQQLEKQTQTQAQIVEILQQRQQQKSEPKFWDKIGDKFQSLMANFQKQRQEKKAARTLLKLFRQEVNPGGQVYQGQEYSITKQENTYTWKSAKGEDLMRFRTVASGGVVVEQNKMNKEHLADVEKLAASHAGEVPDRFASLAAKTESRHQRSEKFADFLVNLARQEGRHLTKTGAQYEVSASPDGSVRILALDGRKTIYQRGRGQDGYGLVTFNKMNDADLKGFEQQVKEFVAKKASPVASQPQVQQSVQTPVVNPVQSNGRRR